MSIETKTRAWIEARDRVLSQYPDLEADEEALFDTVDGEVDLDRAIERVLRSRAEDLGFVAVLKGRIADMKARLDRFERRAEAKKDLVRMAMELTGRTRTLRLAEFTVTPGVSPQAVVVTDEALLPAEYVRTTTAPDKVAIRTALMAKTEVPGATLSNGGPTLTVRSK